MVGRPGEGETQGGAPGFGVEIRTRRDGDVRFHQQALAQGLAVIGQAADIGIDVKGAIRRCEPVEPRLRQAVEQQRAVGAIDVEIAVEFIRRIEGVDGGQLA